MLVLSSRSPTRQCLLTQFNIAFTVFHPDTDEEITAAENISDSVQRLAYDKAQAAVATHPQNLIIGCDTLLQVNEHTLGKPHTELSATHQLQLCSTQILTCYTGLCLLDSRSQHHQICVETYQVKFKALSAQMIQQYLAADQPYQCAGSIKAESLGLTLFEWMRGDDFNTLLGLPLIRLNTMLLAAGYDVLQQQL